MLIKERYLLNMFFLHIEITYGFLQKIDMKNFENKYQKETEKDM
jgi:hypothetical protein